MESWQVAVIVIALISGGAGSAVYARSQSFPLAGIATLGIAALLAIGSRAFSG